jgi:putative ABC transport system permease protein
MLGHHFIIAIRNLKKFSVNSIIKLIGLTVALSSLLIIFFWVQTELSFDKFHKNSDNIYRVVDGNPADRESFAGSPSPLGGFLRENFPEVLSYSRFDISSRIVNVNHTLYNENKVAAADSSFFNIFSFSLLRGKKNEILKKNNAILLSESTARKYFGKDDPIGKTIILDDTVNYEITGIYKDIPGNSHIHFDLLIRFEQIDKNFDWGSWNYFTFIVLDNRTNPALFREKAIRWIQKHYPERLDMMKELYYQPLQQIHFQFNRYNLEPTTEKTNIYAAIVVAFLILVIASINFINLTTLQSIERAKEIAVRKIMGESRFRLRVSLVIEALIVTILSFFLSIILVENILPFINTWLGSKIIVNINDRFFILVTTGLIILTGVLSGIYPAFVLSSFKPVDLFRNSFKLKGKQSFRTSLVIFQFAISIILLISLFMINRQMNFMRSKNLGMNFENVVNIRLQSASISKHAQEIKEEILKNPEVINASVNSFEPSNQNEHWGGIYLNGRTGDDTNEEIGLWIILGDKDFIKTMQIEIKEGEALIDHFTSSVIPFVLNESAARLIKDSIVIGKEFEFRGQNKGRIIGEVKDFHFRSLHHKIEPTAIILYDMGNQISVRFKSRDVKSVLASFENTWNRFSPDLKFDYYFMDENYNTLYKSEMKTNKILLTAGILSMLLCCLGIFGIVLYSAKQRSKEIGLRKVNGASAGQIITMLSKTYTHWIVISFVIACPIAYFTMQKWLQNFAYKTTLAWWIFLAAGILAYLVALLTAGWQSWQVANKNPVEALKYE